ncbi:MAG: glycosyltransferase family 2 protein [Paracoccus sp. (in: a-proteobacteria)]
MNCDFLLSIVIANRNRAEPVIRAALSLLDQTDDPLDIIIVDDCSETDLSAEYALLQSLGVRVITQASHLYGPAARNSGVRAAQGSHVSFLDSDDIWLPGRYDEIRRFYSQPENTGAVLVGGAVLHIDGEIRHVTQPPWRPGSSLLDYVYRDAARVQTSMLSMPVELALSYPFDETLRVNQDTDLAMRLDLAGVGFAVSNTPTLVKEETSDSNRLTMDRRTADLSYQWYGRVIDNFSAGAKSGYHLQDRVWRLADSGRRAEAIFCLLHTLMPPVSLRETMRRALSITLGDHYYSRLRDGYRILLKDPVRSECAEQILARWQRLSRDAARICGESDGPDSNIASRWPGQPRHRQGTAAASAEQTPRLHTHSNRRANFPTT